MPVVIDDLDVEVETSSPSPGSPAGHPAAGPAELTLGHLDEVAQALAARHDRVRAD